VGPAAPGGGLYFNIALQLERNRAVEEKLRAERGEARATEQQDRAEAGEAETRRSLEESRRALYTGQIWRVDGLWRHEPLQALRLLNGDICPPERRDFAWHLYHRACDFQAAWVRPPGGATALAVTADGKTLATAGSDGTVTLWGLPSGKEVATFKGHTGDVNAVAFTRDGRVLASAGADKVIRLWDPATRKDLGTLTGHRSEVRALAFTPDGKTLASASGFEDPKEKNTDLRMKDGELWLWDVPARQGTCVQKHPGGVLCLAMSPDGKTVAAGTTMNWNELLLIDVAERKKAAGPFQTGVGWLQSLAFHPGGKVLALGKADDRVHLWDLETNKQIEDIRGPRGEIESLAFSPDGATLASGTMDGVVQLWDVKAVRGRALERSTFRAHFRGAGALAFVNDTTLVSGGHDGAKVWRLPDRLERATLKGDGQGFHALTVSADGKTLAAGGRSRTLTLWDVGKGKEVKTLSGLGGPVVEVALAPDGGSAAAVSFLLDKKEHEVLEWEFKGWALPGGEERGSFKRPAGDLLVLALAPDGRTVAVAGADGTVALWDAQGRQRGVLGGPGAAVTTLAFTADARVVAAGTAKGEVKAWDAAAGTQRAAFQAHAGTVFGLAFNADGTALATSGVEATRENVITDVAIKLWDAETGRPRLTLQRQLDLFRTLAFTPDGRTLAAGGRDCTVKLWDTTSGHLRTVLPGHTRRITGLAFTPDGNFLVSASGVLGEGWWIKEGEIKLWDATERPAR
jgi:WD40 repeat protein